MTVQSTTATASWHLTGYNDFNYLDSNLSGLRFSQGIVWNGDAGEWISTWQFGMARLTSDFQFLQQTGSVDLSTFEPITGIPKELADMGFDHIGDIDYYDGKLYVSLDVEDEDKEGGDYNNGHIAVFNADDLSYTGEVHELVGAPSNPHHDVASWVAVDGAAKLGYGKEWQLGNTINIYNLTDWSFKGTLTMDQSLKNIQGAKVLDGMMYMAADNSTRSVYSVDLTSGHVVELFQLPEETNVDTEVEGIEARKNADGNVELSVELIIDPDGDSYGDTYTRVFTYTLDSSSTDVPLHHTWAVNTTSDETDSGDVALSLREALAKAEAGDTITFDARLAGQTISLQDAELVLSKDITIDGDLDGDGKADITIDGGTLVNALHVTGGKAVIDGLAVVHDEQTGASSITVDAGASFSATHSRTTNLATSGNDALSGSQGIDVVNGGGGSDMLLGLGGNDQLAGGAGRDMLVGGAGIDVLTGGAGADHFVFATGDSGATRTSADTITDMNGAKGDIIDLHLIDANTVKAGDQAFRFIGHDHFDGRAGELRFATSGDDTYVYGDADGDKKADFALHLTGAVDLKADYFVL